MIYIRPACIFSECL